MLIWDFSVTWCGTWTGDVKEKNCLDWGYTVSTLLLCLMYTYVIFMLYVNVIFYENFRIGGVLVLKNVPTMSSIFILSALHLKLTFNYL